MSDDKTFIFRAEPGETGPAGPRGPMGPRGPKGVAGARGAKGDKGDQGVIGPRGNVGPMGVRGPEGKSGKDGKDGKEGPQGKKGDKGDKGEIGPEGPAGRSGRDGLSGNRGHRGHTGAGVAEGGTTGQVLAKASGTNFDTEWVSPGAASEITGLIEAGDNITIAGTGTAGDPYVINGGAGGGGGLTEEEIQDLVGAMVTSNTETLITVTYQDSDGTIDFVVNNDLSAYSNVTSGFATVSGVAAAYQPLATVLTNTTASFTTAQETKLAGIETAADVTDATNVAAAGAVMDGDFSTNGLMERTGAGAYSVTTITTAGKNLLDDVNAAAQLVTLGLTATAAELNALDGIIATVTELNYTDGVTSAIQTQLDGKVDENSAITGATKTKITYDAKGLVTAGADATTADVSASTDKNYVTDAQQTIIAATTASYTTADETKLDFITCANATTLSGGVHSGTNTGDQTTVSGNAGTATALQNARTIGGTSFDGTANIVPATITVADTADATSFVGLWESATGDLGPKTDAGLTYDATTGTLTATAFSGPLTGNVTGNASGSSGTCTGLAGSATILATARNIGGVSFDGSAAIVPTTIVAANEATDTTCFPSFFTAATGDVLPKTNAALTFNSNTGALGATLLGGTLTTASQPNITGVGTITTGVWTGTDIALADGGTGASLADPNADRIMFWDDSAGAVTWLTPSTGLTITTTSITVDQAAIKPTECIIVAASDETTALTTGTAKVTLRMPYAMTLTDVRASVTTAPTGGTLLTVDVNDGGTTILSTKLTFDASEKTTTTATTPRVISDTALADDAEITIDIDAIGSTIAGAGLKVYLIGNRT